MSEQVKPAPMKKEHSYTYWVGEGNKSRELPEEHRPKKVEPPPLIQSNINTPGPSKWNSLGSWQERSVSMKELGQRVQSDVREWLSSGQSKLQLKEASLQGQFKQIFSNGKRKVLYELNGRLKFDGDELQLKLNELTCSGDREFQVKGKSKEERAGLQALAQQLIDVIVQCFNRFKE